MGIISRITDGIARALGLKKITKVSRAMKDEEIKELAKDLEAERGYKEGIITALEEENKDLRLSIGKQENNEAEELTKQQKQLRKQKNKGAISLKKLMSSKTLPISKKSIKIISHNGKKNFGEFEDILITPEGTFALVTRRTSKNREIVEPVMHSSTIKSMFTNYQGLGNEASFGAIHINLDENGSFVPNIKNIELPELVLDINGDTHYTSVQTKEYIKQIIEREEYIGKLLSRIEASESAMVKISQSKNMEKLLSKLNEGRANNVELEFASAFKSANSMMEKFAEMAREAASRSDSHFLLMQKNEKLEETNTKILSEYDKVRGQDSHAIAKEDLLNDFNEMANITGGAKVQVNLPPQLQYPQQSSSANTMTRKFDKLPS